MWAVMRNFGHANVHRLENVMTLVLPFHVDFAQLMIWLVATVRLT